jgi:hypothetical protein
LLPYDEIKIGMAEAEVKTENQKKDDGDLFATTLQLLKASNPRIGDIITELKTIQKGICLLHDLKAEHRKSYFYLGMQHCRKCAMWAKAQKHLRHKRRVV